MQTRVGHLTPRRRNRPAPRRPGALIRNHFCPGQPLARGARVYGMVNHALEQMVRELHGDATGGRLRQRAGVEVDDFVRLDAYPDALTYALVDAATLELETPASELLRSFGVYWVRYAQKSGYGPLFAASPDYAAFVSQLDAMHARLQLTFRQLRAPRFSCSVVDATHVRVVYQSHRPGLASFVLGLLEGLGPLYRVDALVTHASSDQGPEGVQERFDVTLVPR